jgi:hypothetical protein
VNGYSGEWSITAISVDRGRARIGLEAGRVLAEESGEVGFVFSSSEGVAVEGLVVVVAELADPLERVGRRAGLHEDLPPGVVDVAVGRHFGGVGEGGSASQGVEVVILRLGGRFFMPADEVAELGGGVVVRVLRLDDAGV